MTVTRLQLVLAVYPALLISLTLISYSFFDSDGHPPSYEESQRRASQIGVKRQVTIDARVAPEPSELTHAPEALRFRVMTIG